MNNSIYNNNKYYRVLFTKNGKIHGKRTRQYFLTGKQINSKNYNSNLKQSNIVRVVENRKTTLHKLVPKLKQFTNENVVFFKGNNRPQTFRNIDDLHNLIFNRIRFGKPYNIDKFEKTIDKSKNVNNKNAKNAVIKYLNGTPENANKYRFYALQKVTGPIGFITSKPRPIRITKTKNGGYDVKITSLKNARKIVSVYRQNKSTGKKNKIWHA